MHVLGMSFMKSSALLKFAYAWTTYGEDGFCVKAGMIRTHQLTEYVIDNYVDNHEQHGDFVDNNDLAGKVYLIGFSMGGQIACMLADKYPDRYDGVLDVCGNKDMAAFYHYWKDMSLLPQDANQIKSFFSAAPAYIPTFVLNMIPDGGWLAMPPATTPVLSDVEIECGRTPETRLQAYDRLSPTSHAHITIPVISLIARYDVIVPLQQQMDYYDAVEEAGCLAYYRSYTIGAGHCDSTMVGKVQTYFAKLVAWVVDGVEPPATPTPLP